MYNTEGDVALTNRRETNYFHDFVPQYPKQKLFAFHKLHYVLSTFLNFEHFSALSVLIKKVLIKRVYSILLELSQETWEERTSEVQLKRYIIKKDDFRTNFFLKIQRLSYTPIVPIISYDGADPGFSERGFGQTSAYII